ncbi:MAG: ribonuclease III [Tannerella sp.]|nr:ribonuclease III [Tannerella sp.]
MSLYRLLGFYPNDPLIYKQAFVHRSSSMGTKDGRTVNNERLEFLGDAVLDTVVADLLYRKFPNRKEGFMTNTRSKIVQRESLNRIALKMGLDKMIVSSGRVNSHNNYMYGNAFEALIGAIYLDRGYRYCCRYVQTQIIEKYVPLDKIVRKEVNFKSNLIEWSQKNKLEIIFDLIETFTDKEGSPVFQTSVSLMGVPLGIGIGYTKKESQQSASRMAIRKIRKDKDVRQQISEMKARLCDNKESALHDLPEIGEELSPETA